MQISRERKKDLIEFQKILGIKFRDLSLLNRALIHSSYSNEFPHISISNETLEYLGDSVLTLIVNEYLFRNYNEEFTEGKFAQVRSVIVSSPELVKFAKRVNLGKYLLIGKGEERTGGRNRNSILEDAMEAIIGAYFFDKGLDKARAFILRFIMSEIRNLMAKKSVKDFKSELQDKVQKRYKIRPYYKLIQQTGPEHRKTFFINCEIRNKIYGQGTGNSKREAEQHAARVALKTFELDK